MNSHKIWVGLCAKNYDNPAKRGSISYTTDPARHCIFSLSTDTRLTVPGISRYQIPTSGMPSFGCAVPGNGPSVFTVLAARALSSNLTLMIEEQDSAIVSGHNVREKRPTTIVPGNVRLEQPPPFPSDVDMPIAWQDEAEYMKTGSFRGSLLATFVNRGARVPEQTRCGLAADVTVYFAVSSQVRVRATDCCTATYNGCMKKTIQQGRERVRIARRAIPIGMSLYLHIVAR